MGQSPIDPLLAARSAPSRASTVEAGSIHDRASNSDEDGGSFDEPTPTAPTVRVVEPIEYAYRRLYPRLVRLALLLVDSTGHAEEAVQDAFAKAYPTWARVQDPDAYMRSAVVNNCRRVQRRRMFLRRLPSPRSDDAVLGADHVADVVRSLPLQLRQVVVLRYYLQLSDTEISDALDMAPGTVKSTLHRARARLREALT